MGVYPVKMYKNRGGTSDLKKLMCAVSRIVSRITIPGNVKACFCKPYKCTAGFVYRPRRTL